MRWRVEAVPAGDLEIEVRGWPWERDLDSPLSARGPLANVIETSAVSCHPSLHSLELE
jgi:hypothetical protein